MVACVFRVFFCFHAKSIQAKLAPASLFQAAALKKQQSQCHPLIQRAEAIAITFLASVRK